MPSFGTTPPGTTDEAEAARWVRGMFEDVAPKYDLLNHLLSFNIDRGWRKALMRAMGPALKRTDGRVLDLCCGTGDVLLHLQEGAATRILGADFCHPMLVAAQQKAHRKGFAAPLFEADALQLPVRDNSLGGISVAFGFRNLANYRTALEELHRVLEPGGVLAILEFSHPPGLLMKTAYGFYSRVVLPVIGTAISGSRGAYTYLPESIRKFPKADALRQMMNDAGFERTRFELLTGGIAALHYGEKSAAAGGGIATIAKSTVDIVAQVEIANQP